MGKVLLNGKSNVLFSTRVYNPIGSIENVEKEDLIKLNGILDKLTQNGFFEYYEELRNYYEYLANKYRFDLKTHTIDPATGETVPIDEKDKVYFQISISSAGAN